MIGDPTIALVVEPIFPNCTCSFMQLVPPLEELPPAIGVVNNTESRQVSIALQASSKDQIGTGNHTIEVWETDFNSGYVFKTIFIIDVQAQEEQVEEEPDNKKNEKESGD